jgi:hypothetical protein
LRQGRSQTPQFAQYDQSVKELANSSRAWDNASTAFRQIFPMSTFTRYAFSLFISLYGIYQIFNDHLVPGVIAICLALFVLWIGGRR